MNKEEKISFIIEGELKLMNSIKNGHKPHHEEEFQSLRDLMEKYREDLGYKNNYCHYSGLPSPSAYESENE